MNQREIKFRAWDRKEKQMIYQALEIKNIGLGDGSLVVNEDAQRGNELDWLQYTGLKDKNGKEIYEGDVVGVPYVDPIGRLHKETVSKQLPVIFRNGMFGLEDIEMRGLDNWCERGEKRYVSNYGEVSELKDVTILEVIGNIYENPEFLTNK